MKITGKEQAFPSQYTVIEKENFEHYRSDGRTETRTRNVEKVVVNNGIDIRTHLAGLAMNGMLAGYFGNSYPGGISDEGKQPFTDERFAVRSLRYADALIEELNKGAK